MFLLFAQISATLGISTASATIVVTAINAGMAVIAAIGIITSAGIASAALATIRTAILKKVGTKALVAL